MDHNHRRIIHQNKEILKNKIALENLRIPIEESNIFTKAMLADIFDGKKNLFEEIPSRGPTAFSKFIQVLKDVGCASEALQLEKLQYCDPENTHLSSWTNGCCLIINNAKLQLPKELQCHANLECNDLKDAFKLVWKTTEVYNNKSTQEIIEILNKFTKKNFSKMNLCVVVILGGGAVEQNQNVIYGTDNHYILESEIFNMFYQVSEELSSIPKLFLLPCSIANNASDVKLMKVPNFTDLHLIRWPNRIGACKLFGESLAACFSNCFSSSNLENIDLKCIVENAHCDFNRIT